MAFASVKCAITLGSSVRELGVSRLSNTIRPASIQSDRVFSFSGSMSGRGPSAISDSR